jgi:hypothetical protein
MHPTAFLVLANDQIAELAADTARIRLASEAHRTAAATRAASFGFLPTALRTIARLLRGAVRSVPPVTAG